MGKYKILQDIGCGPKALICFKKGQIIEGEYDPGQTGHHGEPPAPGVFIYVDITGPQGITQKSKQRLSMGTQVEPYADNQSLPDGLYAKSTSETAGEPSSKRKIMVISGLAIAGVTTGLFASMLKKNKLDWKFALVGGLAGLGIGYAATTLKKN